MLTAVPKNWYSWDFNLVDGHDRPWGEVSLSFWRDRGWVAIGGSQYTITRQGWTGSFLLEGPGGTLAEAVKPSTLKSDLRLTIGGREYILKKLSWWGREVGLFKGDVQVGSLAPESWSSRRAKILLPEDLSPWAGAFIVWLTLLMW